MSMTPWPNLTASKALYWNIYLGLGFKRTPPISGVATDLSNSSSTVEQIVSYEVYNLYFSPKIKE
jgi:hypothetical protein